MVPTAPCAAPPKGLAPEDQVDSRSRIMALTNIAGMTGLPEVGAGFGLQGIVTFIFADFRATGLAGE